MPLLRGRYTLIHHCLKGYNKRWIPNKDAEPKFHCGLPGIDIDWPNLSDEALARHANHLSASGSRIACWRYLQRGLGALSLWLSRQLWWQRAMLFLDEVWKTVSPGWKKVAYDLTIQPKGGEARTSTSHIWKRRDWRKALWRWLQNTGQSIAETISQWTTKKSSG